MMLRNPTRHSGFTLIEILISLTIGLLIVSAATSFYQRTIRENLKIKDSSQLHEASFFVSNILTQHLRQVGFKGIDNSMVRGRRIPIPNNKDIFPISGKNWEKGQYLKSTATSLTFRFNGSSNVLDIADGSIIDCAGVPVAAGEVLKTEIVVKDKNLLCISGNTQETLIGGADNLTVENLVISFGIDDENNGSIDRYVSSAKATQDDLDDTREFLLRLLVASPRNLDAKGKSYYFNGIKQTYTDNRYRREILIRASMRNY